ncbi:MAG: ATP-dependent RecD-like DNA helicase [Deltaproteobacteria bacterium]|nr:ATP-dependent RecD-like DNA helicase [Deltaproteobacteria bacterium]
MELEETTLEGTVERIVYANPETGYAVVRLREKDKMRLTTAVGNLGAVGPGEMVRLRGQWISDKRYGLQFRVESYLAMVPATLEGIERYLGSGMIKGIGPVFAHRLVEEFGADTLDVIENRPERISEVEGIGPLRAEQIIRAWEEQKRIRDVMIFLQSYGVSSTYSIKIFKQYGERTVSLVKENPYRLATDIYGIGFRKADQIAQNLGIDPNSPMRAEAGILHVLGQLVEEGHCFYPRGGLTQKAQEILGIDPGILDRALDSLAESGRIVIDTRPDQPVYLADLFVAETGVARVLAELASRPVPPPGISPGEAVAKVESTGAIRLAPGQREALKKSLTCRVLVITGGPGTGKTTVVRSISRVYETLGVKVMLGAPTGRAAKRLSEATGQEAKTIHRLLEYSPREGRFQRDQTHPLPPGLVIIDEASMIDILLMHHLAQALPREGRLILVGDVDQLPSVGPGSVLRDIIDSGRVEVVRLTEIFRQARKSLIVVNAHRVNKGDFPYLKASGQSDFYFLDREEPEDALETIKYLCSERIPRGFGFHPLRDIQVLSPMHRGLLGVSNLNRELQALLNPGGEALQRGGVVFRLGDKVMQIRNNYDREVFNGDVGRIVSLDRRNREMTVRFENRSVVYPFADLDEIVLAYATSVHKSQGSEYPAVVLPVLTQHFVMLQRNLLYTAITRARRLVVLVGTKKALSIAVKNDRIQRRYGLLRERLREGKARAGPGESAGLF